MTTIEPRGGGKGRSYDAFEYIAHSHTYMNDNQPTAKFTYDLSPIQVCSSVLLHVRSSSKGAMLFTLASQHHGQCCGVVYVSNLLWGLNTHGCSDCTA